MRFVWLTVTFFLSIINCTLQLILRLHGNILHWYSVEIRDSNFFFRILRTGGGVQQRRLGHTYNSTSLVKLRSNFWTVAEVLPSVLTSRHANSRCMRGCTKKYKITTTVFSCLGTKSYHGDVFAVLVDGQLFWCTHVTCCGGSLCSVDAIFLSVVGCEAVRLRGARLFWLT